MNTKKMKIQEKWKMNKTKTKTKCWREEKKNMNR
jgi:hypothetical protein